ncbi:hypothetical protein DFH08DRAFT_309769 [Mycena albidolilacea]|uniref:Uncharacterized protein n=1 Tax=Mycena albidolilacea TaxID=1033008 RepID=A0AAD6ZPR1_9AGAR|nr:hypothetical protein DFH08DRAFT_309173 [Mycena albidolilacea]KAJ7331579.1 hypothetical protein DFH08DRAFT_309769 [Mycena albidolilacea]
MKSSPARPPPVDSNLGLSSEPTGKNLLLLVSRCPHSSAPRSSPTRRRFAEWKAHSFLLGFFVLLLLRVTYAREHTAASSMHTVHVCVSNSVAALSSRILGSACFAAHLWTSPAICMLAWHFHEWHTVCYATCARAASLLGHSGRYWRTFLFSGPLPLREYHRALWRHRPRRWRGF